MPVNPSSSKLNFLRVFFFYHNHRKETRTLEINGRACRGLTVALQTLEELASPHDLCVTTCALLLGSTTHSFLWQPSLGLSHLSDAATERDSFPTAMGRETGDSSAPGLIPIPPSNKRAWPGLTSEKMNECSENVPNLEYSSGSTSSHCKEP